MMRGVISTEHQHGVPMWGQTLLISDSTRATVASRLSRLAPRRAATTSSEDC